MSLIQVNTASPVGVTKGDIYNLMIEEGTVATPYTPYIEDVSSVGVGITDADGIYNEMANASGTVKVTSSYPSMTLTALNTGAVVDVSYNRDINKAFGELMQAINTLGGNV
jgi:hypothetical protein